MTIGVDARARRCYAAVARSERNERRTVRRFATTTRILNENAPAKQPIGDEKMR